MILFQYFGSIMFNMQVIEPYFLAQALVIYLNSNITTAAGAYYRTVTISLQHQALFKNHWHALNARARRPVAQIALLIYIINTIKKMNLYY
jgi:hypothetical protein